MGLKKNIYCYYKHKISSFSLKGKPKLAKSMDDITGNSNRSKISM